MADPNTATAPRPRLQFRHLIGLDVLAMGGFALVAINDLIQAAPDRVAPVPVQAVLAAAMCIPVATRRFLPLTSFGIVLFATIASVLLDGHNDWFAAAGFTLYLVATQRAFAKRGLTTIVAAVTLVTLPCLMTAGTSDPTGVRVSSVLVGLVVLGAAWTTGQAVRDRRVAVAEAARRLAEQEVAEERLRIARELHDIVGNTLSLIAVKAQVANHLGEQRPQAPAEALADIETAAKESLTQMRATLGILRVTPDAASAHNPTDFSDLMAIAGHAGVEVEAETVPIDDLPADVQLASRRIIHEAVTNVIKHAAPTHCRVTMQRNLHQLTLSITDTGPGSGGAPTVSAPSTGNGINGMAERIATFHGRFDAGPTATGFEVRAVIPLSGDLS